MFVPREAFVHSCKCCICCFSSSAGDKREGEGEVAEKLCDKVAIIKGGRLIRSGTMEEVRGDASLEDVFLELEG